MPRETTLQKYIRLARDESHCFNEDHFDHFRFEGYYNAGNNWRDWYVPVYRVYAVDGANFAYCYGAWQSSMCGLELLE